MVASCVDASSRIRIGVGSTMRAFIFDLEQLALVLYMIPFLPVLLILNIVNVRFVVMIAQTNYQYQLS